MRIRFLSFCAAAWLLLAPAAPADVLTLTDGGQVKGTLETVTLFLGGKNVEYPRAQLAAVWISETASDYVVLKDETKVKGELLSIKIKSVGGTLTYKRNEVKLVKFAADPRAQARKELAAKRAAIAAEDAKGLLDLALWCRENKLGGEAAALARASLQANSRGEAADQAHELLGHVRYQGLWLTRAEWARQKKIDGIDAEPDAPPDNDPKTPDEPPDPVVDAKLTPEQVKAIRAALAADEQLRKAYLKRAENQARKEMNDVKTTLGGSYNAALSDVRRISDTLDRKEKELKAYKKSGSASGSMNSLTGILRQQKNTAALEAEIKKLKSELTDAKRKLSKQASLVKTEQAKVRRRAVALARRVRLAASKIKNTLRGGKLLTHAEMSKVYDAALDLN